MIFLDRPYVSDFFLNYLCESGRAVRHLPFRASAESGG